MPPKSPSLIAGIPVLFVMAAEAEYGPELRSRFDPLITGIGPVEAAVKLAAALAGMPRLPELIVSLGSAGSARLEQAQVYQVTAVAYRDMDASLLGFEKGRTPLLDLPVRVEMPCRIDGCATATLSTGANIVNGSAFDDIAEDMVDMETFAHLRAAQHFRVPLVGLRGISDGAAKLQHISDWTQYLHIVDARLATVVDRLADQLADGKLIPTSPRLS